MSLNQVASAQHAAKTLAEKVPSRLKPAPPRDQSPIKTWFDGVTEKVGKTIDQHHDNLIESSTKKILQSIGAPIFRMIEDPYLPQPFKSWMATTFTKLWEEVQVELLNDVMRSYGRHDIHIAARESRLDHWPERPSFFKCCRRDYSCCEALLHFPRALRARFLYADNPADGSAWKVLRDPLGLLIFVLKLHITTSVATFALFFILMDKRDEAQLVRFILKFKTVMFLTAGILPAASLGMGVHACLTAIDAGTPDLCVQNAPSSSPYFALSFLSELVRLVLIAFAFFVLACGHAVGGDEEIAALEYTRLETSCITPRGGNAASSSSSAGANAADGGAGALPKGSPRMQDPEVVNQLLEQRRAAWGAERRVGGALPYFLAFDLCVLCGLIGGWWYVYVYEPYGGWEGDRINWGWQGVDTSSPLFWSSLYNLKVVYGLCSFPFLVFELPIIGTTLTKCRDTAYNQTGQLVVKLAKSDVATLYERREEALAKAQGGNAAASAEELQPSSDSHADSKKLEA